MLITCGSLRLNRMASRPKRDQPVGLELSSGIQSYRMISRRIVSPNPEIAQYPDRSDTNSTRSPNVERSRRWRWWKQRRVTQDIKFKYSQLSRKRKSSGIGKNVRWQKCLPKRYILKSGHHRKIGCMSIYRGVNQRVLITCLIEYPKIATETLYCRQC